MISVLFNILVNALAIVVAVKLVPGVEISTYTNGITVAIVLLFLNLVLKPILKFITLPLSFFSFGLFSVLINGLIILVADRLVEGFFVEGFLTAMLFGLILGVVNSLLGLIKK